MFFLILFPKFQIVPIFVADDDEDHNDKKLDIIKQIFVRPYATLEKRGNKINDWKNFRNQCHDKHHQLVKCLQNAQTIKNYDIFLKKTQVDINGSVV